jgi:CheY-like chemotaxis protein
MKKRVLIIEDNPGVRENTAEILELAGYEAVLAEDGKQGVDLAVKENPDLILCDIMMPGLDGYGVLHILSQRVETAGIPFIFLTAKTEKNDVRYGMSLGADDYITKPFEETDLLRTIAMHKAKALR